MTRDVLGCTLYCPRGCCDDWTKEAAHDAACDTMIPGEAWPRAQRYEAHDDDEIVSAGDVKAVLDIIKNPAPFSTLNRQRAYLTIESLWTELQMWRERSIKSGESKS